MLGDGDCAPKPRGLPLRGLRQIEVFERSCYHAFPIARCECDMAEWLTALEELRDVAFVANMDGR